MTTMLSLTQKLAQQQKLTPQQLQYLKLLQLSVLALEQRVKEELEMNPLLEESGGADADEMGDPMEAEERRADEREIDWEEIMPEGTYDGYAPPSSVNRSRDEDSPDIPQPAEESLLDLLLAQLRMQSLTDDELVLAEEILGNIDSDGYLRRDLSEIVDDLNTFISETSRATPASPATSSSPSFESYDTVRSDKPFGRERLNAQMYAPSREEAIATEEDEAHEVDEAEREEIEEGTNGLSGIEPEAEDTPEPQEERTIADLSLEEMANLPIEELARILERGTSRPAAPGNGRADTPKETPATTVNSGDTTAAAPEIPAEDLFSRKDAEQVLHRIQRLDPPGIGARDLRECLLIQLESVDEETPEVRLARRVLADAFQEFTMKHFEKICRKLECTEDELREAINVIVTLNPKPGEGAVTIPGGNYVTPDFVVVNDGENFTILPNDRFIPALRISTGYRDMLRRDRKPSEGGVDRSTRKFLREKLESAKWFIASIHQRRQTMLKIMRAIVELQADFFRHGPEHLRPMIYKDVAERIGMDISTICRVVNGKYVQTDYGVFELRYFFSEALETAWGEEVSNKVVKAKIKQMIDAEDKGKPLSDEAISDRMKEMGYNVARRTVAKYREQMNVPVARLRRSL